MQDFWRNFFPFLFKQAPVVVFMTVALWLYRIDMDGMEARHLQDRMDIRQECAASIDELRQDLKICQNDKDTLRRENLLLVKRVGALEARLNR